MKNLSEYAILYSVRMPKGDRYLTGNDTLAADSLRGNCAFGVTVPLDNCACVKIIPSGSSAAGDMSICISMWLYIDLENQNAGIGFIRNS